jgi:NodT family efflux transporter outer membrane factor (OMF) lipoprotein
VRARPLAPLAFALATAGCAGEVSTERPEFAVPAEWSQPVAADPAAVFPAAGWWRGFGSEELARLIATAQRNNPDLAAADYRIAAATAQARVARAGLFPTLDASADRGRSWRAEELPTDSFGVDFQAAYEVDLWGRNRFAASAAEATTTATVHDREAAALSLVAEVATSYFQYLSFGDRLANARRILDTAEQVLELVELQAEVGTVSGLEVAQQRGAVAGLRANIPALEQQRQQSLNALAQLLGTTPGTLSIEATSLADLRVPAVAAGLPSEVLERRPDLRSALAALVAARADAASARAAMFPTIRLTGSTGYSSAELSSLFTPMGFAASIAGGLAQPLFDAGRLAGQSQAAKARQGEQAEAYRAAVMTAFMEVENALAATRYLAEEEAAERVAYDEAERAYELAQTRYRAGLVDFLSVLETQRSLYAQQDSLEQTHLARLSAAVAMFRALGGGW